MELIRTELSKRFFTAYAYHSFCGTVSVGDDGDKSIVRHFKHPSLEDAFTHIDSEQSFIFNTTYKQLTRCILIDFDVLHYANEQECFQAVQQASKRLTPFFSHDIWISSYNQDGTVRGYHIYVFFSSAINQDQMRIALSELLKGIGKNEISSSKLFRLAFINNGPYKPGKCLQDGKENTLSDFQRLLDWYLRTRPTPVQPTTSKQYSSGQFDLGRFLITQTRTRNLAMRDALRAFLNSKGFPAWDGMTAEQKVECESVHDALYDMCSEFIGTAKSKSWKEEIKYLKTHRPLSNFCRPKFTEPPKDLNELQLARWYRTQAEHQNLPFFIITARMLADYYQVSMTTGKKYRQRIVGHPHLGLKILHRGGKYAGDYTTFNNQEYKEVTTPVSADASPNGRQMKQTPLPQQIKKREGKYMVNPSFFDLSPDDLRRVLYRVERRFQRQEWYTLKRKVDEVEQRMVRHGGKLPVRTEIMLNHMLKDVERLSAKWIA